MVKIIYAGCEGLVYIFSIVNDNDIEDLIHLLVYLYIPNENRWQSGICLYNTSVFALHLLYLPTEQLLLMY